MFKFIQVALIASLMVVCLASPAHLKNVRQTRLSARQTLAEDVPSQTPYPPAGIVPEVRFDLPTEQDSTFEPDNTYLPPDNSDGTPAKTYGPPDSSIDDETEVEAEADEQSDQPGNIGISQEPLNDEGEDNEIEDPQLESEPQSERLTRRRLSRFRSAKLQTRPFVVQRSQRLVAQPIYFADGRVFVYSQQFNRI